jgi:hypothetical protein
VLWVTNSVMYFHAAAGLQRCYDERRSKQFGEVRPREAPLKRLCHYLLSGLKAEDRIAGVLDRGRVRRSKDLPLKNGEVSQDLVQPTGMNWNVDESQVACYLQLTKPRPAIGRYPPPSRRKASNEATK